MVNQKGQPISVSRTGESEDDEDDKNLGREVSGEEAWNVILWADHRAEEEAEQINATGEGVLGFVGKTMSVSRVRGEKLSLTFSSRWRSQRRFGSASTWTRRSLRPVCFSSECFCAARFKIRAETSLPDYLTYRATTSLARSNCSLACKCSFVPPGATMTHDCDGGAEEVSKDGWSARFFNKIGQSEHAIRSKLANEAGLEQMVKDDFEQLGGIPGKNGLVLTAGQPVGNGLSKEAAAELGLVEGTAVGSGVIDA